MAKKKAGVVNIRGKEYATVALRVAEFRKKFPDGEIVTEPVDCSSERILFRATVIIGGVALATGHAEEERGSSQINTTSALENCETSAVGRALAFAGFGADESISSADEVSQAISQQEKPKPAAAKTKTFSAVRKEAWGALREANTREKMIAVHDTYHLTMHAADKADDWLQAVNDQLEAKGFEKIETVPF